MWAHVPLAVCVPEVSWETSRCHVVSSEVSVLFPDFSFLAASSTVMAGTEITGLDNYIYLWGKTLTGENRWLKGLGLCACARVCVWATKGCSDAGRQTFLELPGNPLATKRGECGAYDALCNRGDEFEEKEWNNPCPQLLLFIASGKDRIEKERIYRRSGLVALFCGCMYHAFEQH